MKWGFVGLFILPWLEAWLVIQLRLAAAFLVMICTITAAIGIVVARRENLTLFTSILSDWHNKRMPTLEGVDASLLLGAGWLLIAPGMITDCLGFALLIPQMRLQVTNALRNGFF